MIVFFINRKYTIQCRTVWMIFHLILQSIVITYILSTARERTQKKILH